MVLDDPKTPEFASWRSYQEFAHRVRRANRYVWENDVQAFLDTVLATNKGRDVKISKDSILYRAQRGVDYRAVFDDAGDEVGEEPVGFSAKRMRPLAHRASEGRVNPAGIPMLYLASLEQTAISEVRPWIGSEISVAQFRIVRTVKAIDLSIGHGQSSFLHLPIDQLFDNKKMSAETKAKAVWTDIDNAFSRPVTHSDDTADYVPTQILAELFRHAGYDAVVYRSQFGENGYNVALFEVAAAEAINWMNRGQGRFFTPPARRACRPCSDPCVPAAVRS